MPKVGYELAKGLHSQGNNLDTHLVQFLTDFPTKWLLF